MQIVLSGKEFDSAMASYVSQLGFDSTQYHITTRTVVGRGDAPSTTVTITLDEKPSISTITARETTPVFEAMGISRNDLSAMDIQIATGVATSSFSQRASQGHADE